MTALENAPEDPQGLWALLAAYGVVISLPLLAMMIWTTIDIWRRPGVTRRGLWTAACWLFWPTMLAYFAIRPMAPGGNRHRTGSQADPRGELVRAIISHDEGSLAGASFRAQLASMRPPRSTPGPGPKAL